MRVVSILRTSLLPFVVVALAVGAVAWASGTPEVADVVWSAATAVVVVELVVVTAVRLREGRVAVDVVALVALVGALGLGESLAGVVLALMVASGDQLERFAQRRAARSLSALLSLAPRLVHRRVDGGFDDVPIDAARPGDIVLVKPGEVVPVDGVALEPVVIDASVLTGESRPVELDTGDLVQSGAVNAGHAFSLRAAATAADSAYAGIVALVRGAGVGKAPSVRLADRYALWFIPVVFLLAGGSWLATGDLTRALAVLVVATPCPLVLAAPVAVVSGISSAARAGVIVKDGGALEAMGRARTVLFDKTGTLTVGRSRVVAVVPGPGWDTRDVLGLAASVEQKSPHVLAAVLVREARARGLPLCEPEMVEERAGAGVAGTVSGRRVWVGTSPEFVAGRAPDWVDLARRRARREGCNVIAVVVDDDPAGMILFTDEIRPDAPRALRALRRSGVDRIVMVTGDDLAVAEPIGSSIGMDAVYAERTPEEKLDIVRRESGGGRGTTVMVGDGVNDAPALAAADLGVAMGARGATASSEAADVVLVADRLDRLADGVVIAQRARLIAQQSVLLGMGLSFAGMGLAAVGLLAPVGGAVAQEVIDVLAIANALRALRPPPAAGPTSGVPPMWGHQLDAGHGPMRVLLEDLRAAAGALDELEPARARTVLAELSERVTREIVAHERIDETVVYPDIASHLGGDDPLGALSRTHQEIFHLASLLRRLVSESSSLFDEEDRGEARRILYALEAVARLHFAQEEELLMGLGGTEPSE